MQIEITPQELGLCIGALELGVKELREGKDAADRLGTPLPPVIASLADQMEALRARLLREGGLNA